MGDPAGIPLGVLLLALVVVPAVIAVLLGVVAMRSEPSLVFRCQRCGDWFQRRAYRPFPAACTRCGSRDWNTQG
jgi:hypothetical protein